ncbi:SPOR domain-containing protein [Paenibacillus sp. J22TS3]|uniref:SPOR domain-containing protein n=1 Tax=Paenibacillus sp. J22TS3 TaxID=2807192 RepID=UPI001B25A0C3|nr:SPOR domain-containing protein [Paenibacillus sp. J22TS3]GIP22416.1 hypothetical protein J22TS3_26910 [Paenibacillus sp. J22TS3]
MNKARMTFRFDEQETNPLSPGRQSEHKVRTAGVNDELDRKPERSINRGIEQDAGRDTVQAVDQVTDQAQRTPSLVMDPLESWGEPFQSHSQMALPVISGDRDRGFLYENEDIDSIMKDALVPGDNVYYISPKRPSKWKLFGSIAAATVTGVLFGFVVLSLFNKDVSLSIPGLTSASHSGNPSAISVLGSPDNLGDPGGAAPVVKAVLPEQSYYFLQYGVFNSPQGVKQAQEELLQSGVAAAMDTQDNKRVYAGVSPEREQAKLLSSQLKSSGVNLIVHEVIYPASAEIKYSGDAGVLDQYLEDSADLVKLLSVTSAGLLESKEGKKQSAGEIANLKQKHRGWTEHAAAVKSSLPEDTRQTAAMMEKSMSSAVKALDEYNNNGSKTHLWEVQTAMMEYIMLQKKLLGIN